MGFQLYRSSNVPLPPSEATGESYKLWADAVTDELNTLSQSVYDVRDFGAKGDGSTDDTGAIQAVINELANVGGTIYFAPGRYQISSALELINTTSDSFNGIILAGAGWTAGSTPASNDGSWIEYTGNSGSLFTVRGRAAGTGYVRDLVLRDIGIQATDTSYSGDLVELRTVSYFTADRVGFYGRTDVSPDADLVLIYGNEWVDLLFRRCVFHSAGYGISQESIGGFSNFANVIKWEHCEFNRLTITMDVELSVQEASLVGCTSEPAADSSESPIRVFANPVIVERNWFGDGDTSANWLELKGAPIQVTGNYIAGAAIGLQVRVGSRGGIIAGNTFSSCFTGISHEATAAPGCVVAGNWLSVQTDGVGVAVVGGKDLSLINNTIDKDTGATGTTGYKLFTDTAGWLVDNQAGTANTHITDNSGGFTKCVNYQEESSYSIAGFSPSRWFRVQGITNLSTPVGGGICDFSTVVARSQLNLPTSSPPASGTASGTTGDMEWDTSYVYVCTSTDSWSRATLNTF
jgi:hypothetical protein